MNYNYAVIGCIPNFSMNLVEFLRYDKILFKSKNYDMISKEIILQFTVELIIKLHNDSNVGFLLITKKLVKSFASRDSFFMHFYLSNPLFKLKLLNISACKAFY